MSALLQTEGLTKYFSFKKTHFKAVDNVSITIERGKTYGLVGESGSGKTTLSSMLLGLTPPDSGRVLFEGQDTGRLRGKEKKVFFKKAQMIFQNPFESLDPTMRIFDIIEEPLLIHKIGKTREERKKIVNEMRTLTGLDLGAMERRPAELSGGQRQRVAIATAMILRPSLVICDEAVSALDVLVQAQILNLLKDFQKSFGISYLFISHNLDVVRYMADTIGVMHQGKIVEEGPSEIVLKHPKSDYTKELLAAKI